MKPSLTSDQHVELLLRRGLDIDDPVAAANFFDRVGYYRFSGYARYFQRAPHIGDDSFDDKSSFADIQAIYLADEALRATLLAPLAQGEIALRASVTRVIADGYSPYSIYLEEGWDCCTDR